MYQFKGPERPEMGNDPDDNTETEISGADNDDTYEEDEKES